MIKDWALFISVIVTLMIMVTVVFTMHYWTFGVTLR